MDMPPCCAKMTHYRATQQRYHTQCSCGTLLNGHGLCSTTTALCQADVSIVGCHGTVRNCHGMACQTALLWCSASCQHKPPYPRSISTIASTPGIQGLPSPCAPVSSFFPHHLPMASRLHYATIDILLCPISHFAA